MMERQGWSYDDDAHQWRQGNAAYPLLGGVTGT